MKRRQHLAWLASPGFGGCSLLAPRVSAIGNEQDVRDVVREAVIWGWPLVVMERTRQLSLHRPVAGGAPGTVNGLRHAQRLATHRNRNVVMPNNDTLYSSAWIDLRLGPLWLELPAEPVRYLSYQLLDAYTETVRVLHAPKVGAPGRWLIVAPGWRGQPPPGADVVHCSTPRAWLLGRTAVNGPADIEAATVAQRAATLRGLGPEIAPPVATPLARLESPQDASSRGMGMLDEITNLLSIDLPTPASTPLTRRLASIDLVPGAQPSVWLARRGWDTAATEAVAAAAAQVRERAGQSLSAGSGAARWTHDVVGVYGDDHLLRAATALRGLGALPPTEALYFSLGRTSEGGPLRGSQPVRWRFNPGRLPPFAAFWSLSLYDASDFFFVDNPLGRYAIGAHTPGLPWGADGSVDIDIGALPPERGTAAWLPAPPSPYVLVFRVYRPGQAAPNFASALEMPSPV